MCGKINGKGKGNRGNAPRLTTNLGNPLKKEGTGLKKIFGERKK